MIKFAPYLVLDKIFSFFQTLFKTHSEVKYREMFKASTTLPLLVFIQTFVVIILSDFFELLVQ
jgi:hypothetical protein